MDKIELTKRRGWLNKSEMAESLGISTQAFDKWGVEPVTKIGRETFYTTRSVLENRLGNAERKQQPEVPGLEGVDPYAEIKLTMERLRLTTAQAYAQEQKNMAKDKLLVPVTFATFALARVIAQVAAKLEPVGKTVARKHPEVDPRVIESFERELATARNLAVDAAEQLPELLDEYVESMAE